ncbi:MAG TPA: phosphotransferase family protein [Candidatus Binataceae bacterium]|jgi:aminoglycoside phosphotransferase (APT) family kinase protein|nr:phosphotransferase family protein [Candidatus Binataceae bacterium]
METHEKTGPSATIDVEGLRRFLRDQKLGDADDLRCENISFGHSNEVHLIHFEGHSWALRRPPRGPLLPTAHDVLREYRVLKALQPTPVPIPRVYAACDDSAYIGAPFYLMEYMRGSVIRSGLIPSAEKSFADTPERRRAISEGIIDLLVALQTVDWRAVGLEGFGRPDGYLERQLRRWIDQLDRTLPLTRPLPLMAEIRDWLKQHFPASPPPTIVHGDFKLDNVMWDPSGARPRVIALFDWEMSTIGDPLADLGWMLTYWSDQRDSEERRAVVSSMEVAPGYLSRAEMAELYREQAGRAMTDFTFYEVFSLFKLAIILEGSYSRYLRGQADDPMFATYDTRVPGIAQVAWEICRAAR